MLWSGSRRNTMVPFTIDLYKIIMALYTNKSLTPDKNAKPESEESTFGRSSHVSSMTLKSNYVFPEPQISPFFVKSAIGNSRRLQYEIKRGEKIKRRQIMKAVLNRIVITRYANLKIALKNLEKLPKLQSQKNKSRAINNYNVAQDIIFSTPLTVQTAILRSIANLRNKKQDKLQSDQQIEQSKGQERLSISLFNHNVTIFPHEEFSVKYQQRDAILLLIKRVNQQIRSVLSAFHKSKSRKQKARAYLLKLAANFKANQQYFLEKLRLVNSIYRNSVLSTKRKKVQSLINSCLRRRQKLILDNLKQNRWILFGKRLSQTQSYGQGPGQQIHCLSPIAKLKESSRHETNSEQNSMISAGEISLFSKLDESRLKQAKQIIMRRIVKSHIRGWKRIVRGENLSGLLFKILQKHQKACLSLCFYKLKFLRSRKV